MTNARLAAACAAAVVAFGGAVAQAGPVNVVAKARLSSDAAKKAGASKTPAGKASKPVQAPEQTAKPASSAMKKMAPPARAGVVKPAAKAAPVKSDDKKAAPAKKPV